MRNASWWSERRLGLVSVAISLVEVCVVYGAVTSIVLRNLHRTPPQLAHLASSAWLLGTFSAFAFAIAGLVADSQRLTALVAVVLAIVTFLICGLQMLV